MASPYADENFPKDVVEELRTLGHDVWTAHQAGQANQRIPDPLVLQHACSLNRAVITHNGWDFIRLHRQSQVHSGIPKERADFRA